MPRAQCSRHARNPNPESRKFLFCLWNLKSWKLFGILGFGIRHIAQGIWNATNDWNPAIHGVESKIQDCLVFIYMGRLDDALTSDSGRNWNSLMTLFIWAASLAMKMAFGEMLIRYGWEGSEGYLVYHSESTKIQLYISCVNKLGVFKWREY